jgi:vacuolar-type H+-ATPase subunit E/Vma4
MGTRTTKEHIQALSRAVLSEARLTAEQALSKAEEEAEVMRQHAQEQATAEYAEILGHARQEAERVRSQAIAATQLKARSLQLEHREKLLDSVFAAAQQQLSTARQWTDYGDIVQRLLREALIHLGADAAQIRADEQTQHLLTPQILAEIAEELGIQVHIGTPLEYGIGVIVETLDGHRQYDNTLETRLLRMQDSLRAPVHRILIGEPL